jgi:hypothetical protein
VPSNSLVLPVGSAVHAPAGQLRGAVLRLDSAVRGGPAKDLPVLPLPPVVGSAPGALPTGLLPPSRSSKPGSLEAGGQVPDAQRPGSRPKALPDLSSAVAGPVSPDVVAVRTQPAPHPLPAPGPGVPSLPAGGTGQAPGNPHSLPLAEPVLGPALGPAAGPVSPRAAGAAGVRQRAYLPDTPPG